MPKLRKTLFISDLHLDERWPKTFQMLQNLLADTTNVDAVYILGDLFEAWIGDDDETPFHLQVVELFQSITQKGVTIYFTHGNRDFLIGKQFLRKSGCRMLPTEKIINLYDTKVLVMHGDTLCTSDACYLKVRKIFHNKWIQGLFLLLPLKIRKKIATALRKKSQTYTQKISETMMDVSQSEVESIMQKYKVNYLIHGHTHRPAMHEITTGTRFVLGAWHDKPSVLTWDETGNCELMF